MSIVGSIRIYEQTIADIRKRLNILEGEKDRLVSIHRRKCPHHVLCAKEFPGACSDGTAYTICPSCGKREKVMENRSRGGYDIRAKEIFWLLPEQFDALFPEGKNVNFMSDEIDALRTRKAV